MASVTKRRWKKPDGSIGEAWTVRYVDPATGKHPAKTFTLKKEADAYRRQIERSLDDGTHIARSSSRTVAELLDEYIDHLDRRVADQQVSQRYVDGNRRALRHVKSLIGGLIVKDLTWQRVETLIKDLRAIKSRNGGTLANGTVRLTMLYFHIAMGFAVRRGYAFRNVIPDAMKETGRLPVEAIETFSREEMRRIVATIEERAPRQSARTQAFLRAAVYLSAMCGLRRGEILALTWDAIDFHAGKIVVRQNITLDDVVKGPKTAAGNRTIPLPRAAAAALEAWRPFVVPEPRGLIFRSRGGGSWQDAAFYRDTWHPLLRRAGIATERARGQRHFHALRHFAGSAWLDGGVPLPEVSRMLGHANMGVTAAIYSHAVAEVHHRAPELDACAGLLTSQAVTHGLRMSA